MAAPSSAAGSGRRCNGCGTSTCRRPTSWPRRRPSSRTARGARRPFVDNKFWATKAQTKGVRLGPHFCWCVVVRGNFACRIIVHNCAKQPFSNTRKIVHRIIGVRCLPNPPPPAQKLKPAPLLFQPPFVSNPTETTVFCHQIRSEIRVWWVGGCDVGVGVFMFCSHSWFVFTQSRIVLRVRVFERVWALVCACVGAVGRACVLCGFYKRDMCQRVSVCYVVFCLYVGDLPPPPRCGLLGPLRPCFKLLRNLPPGG